MFSGKLSRIHALPQLRRFSFLSDHLEFNPKIPVEEAHTPPNTWYTCPEFYKQEIEKIWKKNWVCADFSLNLTEPGKFKTGKIGNEPYIITKSGNGDLNAFYNVCLHHGSVIEQKSEGKSDCLRCPYHGWTYNMEGQLIKCSSMKGIKNFKVQENRLKKIGIFNYGNLCFLNFNKEAKMEEIQRITENFGKAHLERKIDPMFGKMNFVLKKDYIINCNWKIYVDNWLDGGYHVPILHQDLNKVIEMKQYLIRNFYKLNIQEAPGYSSDRIGNHAIYSFIFPNAMIARYGPWLDISLIFPLAVDKCLVTMKWFIKEEKKGDQKFIDESLKASFQIQDEDVFISQEVMKGVLSDGYKRGRYSPLKESGMHCFHRQIFEELNN